MYFRQTKFPERQIGYERVMYFDISFLFLIYLYNNLFQEAAMAKLAASEAATFCAHQVCRILLELFHDTDGRLLIVF